METVEKQQNTRERSIKASDREFTLRYKERETEKVNRLNLTKNGVEICIKLRKNQNATIYCEKPLTKTQDVVIITVLPQFIGN